MPGVVRVFTCFDVPENYFPTAGHPWSTDPAHQDVADRLLLARVLDKYEQCQRKNIPAATPFLSPREQAMAQSLLAAAGVRDGFLSDGGYQEAERKILVFLPDWADAPPEVTDHG